MLFIYQ